MELLNLDSLAPAERKVIIGGVEYPIVKQTVRQMIKTVKVAEAANISGNESEKTIAMMDAMMDAAKALIPDAPESIIEGLSVAQVTKLMEFANAAEDEQPDSTSKKTKK